MSTKNSVKENNRKKTTYIVDDIIYKHARYSTEYNVITVWE